MTLDEAVEKASDLLPEKLILLHVQPEVLPHIWAMLGYCIFTKANGLPVEHVIQLLRGE